MSRETISSSGSEAELSRPAVLFESVRRQLLAKAALGAGVLACAFAGSAVKPNSALAHQATSGQTQEFHPLQYVGMTSNQIWVTDRQAAIEAAQQIAATGANTVRMFEPDSPTQTVVSGEDKERLCDAATAAESAGLTLEISPIGFHKNRQLKKIKASGFSKYKHNYVPASATEVTKYLTYINNIIWTIAGPNANKPGPNAEPPCVDQPLTKLIVDQFNEVGSSGFNANPDPAKYAYLISRAGPALEKDTANINQAFGASEDAPRFILIQVIGSLAVGNHDPLGFVRQFDQALKKLGATLPAGAMLGLHPYPKDPTTNPADVIRAIYEPIRAQLDDDWGKDIVPIYLNEVGVGAINENSRDLYGPRSLAASAVTEGTQAEYYKDSAEEASLEGAAGFLTFQSRDVRNDGWPDGLYRPNGKRKDSWNTVSVAFHDALTGDFSDSNF